MRKLLVASIVVGFAWGALALTTGAQDDKKVAIKEVMKVAMKGGLSSARNDIGSLEQKFKKVYIDSKYTPEELDKKFTEWEALMRKLFIRKQ